MAAVAAASVAACSAAYTGTRPQAARPPRKPEPCAGKCPGCGSHSFIARDGEQVCTYCRAPQTEVK